MADNYGFSTDGESGSIDGFHSTRQPSHNSLGVKDDAQNNNSRVAGSSFLNFPNHSATPAPHLSVDYLPQDGQAKYVCVDITDINCGKLSERYHEGTDNNTELSAAVAFFQEDSESDSSSGSATNGTDVNEAEMDDAQTTDGIQTDHELQLLTVPGRVPLPVKPELAKVEDGAIAVSIRVPVLPRRFSEPTLTSSTFGKKPEPTADVTDGAAAQKDAESGIPKKKTLMEMTREEMIKKYRIHFFVLFFFLLTVILVSLAWYYKNMAVDLLYASQAIFFNPRTRKLSLTDPLSTSKIQGKLGQDIPQWQLPLHCPMVMKNPHNKECIWKEHAILRIDHTRATGIQCYTVSWESLTPLHSPYDCFEVADGEWYGPSNNSDSTYPIRGEFLYQPTHSSSRRDGVFGAAVNFYWLSSTGTGLYVISDNPVQVSWNRTGDNMLCIRANYSGSLYHQDSTTELARLNYTLCKGVDAVVTHTHMQNMSLQGALKFPPEMAFSGAWWSVPDIVQSGTVNQSHVEALMKSLAENGFVNNKLTLDVDWEGTTGDLTFDPQRFPNISDVMDSAKNRSNEIVLSVSPYFKYTTQNFNEGVAGSFFIQDAGGEVAGLTRYQSSLAAVLDATNPQATAWFAKKLQALKGSGIDSFRLSYGSQGWLPYKPQFYRNDSMPGTFRKLMTELMGNNSDLLTVDYTSDSRHVAGFVPVPAIVDSKTKCLTGAIDTALTLGLMGYPFILLDGIRAQPTEPEFSSSNKPSEELFIRWLQLAAMFPAYQFNIPPWSFRPDVTIMAANLTTQRLLLQRALASEDLRREVEAGLPIIRPIWWLNPTPDVHAMKAKDQYLIGSSLLVAPILCEKQTTRDIFVPSGVWEDLKLHKVVIGPRLLKDYAVEPYEIPVFSYRKEHDV